MSSFSSPRGDLTTSPLIHPGNGSIFLAVILLPAIRVVLPPVLSPLHLFQQVKTSPCSSSSYSSSLAPSRRSLLPRLLDSDRPQPDPMHISNDQGVDTRSLTHLRLRETGFQAARRDQTAEQHRPKRQSRRSFLSHLWRLIISSQIWL